MSARKVRTWNVIINNVCKITIRQIPFINHWQVIMYSVLLPFQEAHSSVECQKVPVQSS